MTRGKKLCEGKTKILFEGPEPGTVIQHFKDDTTAFDGEKHEIIAGKGVLNNRISAFIMEQLYKANIQTHFVKSLNMREQLVREVEIIPIEIIVRNYAAGRMAKRLGLKEGTRISCPIIEYNLKNDELHDPVITEDEIYAFEWATPQELEDMYHTGIRVNDFLGGLFAGVGLKLVDFKLEFGRLTEDDHVKIVLADEISPDSCRIWDAKTNRKLDKDCFRYDLDNIVETYQEIAYRLGVMTEAEFKQALQTNGNGLHHANDKTGTEG